MSEIERVRIIITGSRHWTDGDAIRSALRRVTHHLGGGRPGLRGVLVHGAAPGADTIGAEVALSMGWEVEPFPADWGKLGNRAGPIRNSAMVKAGAHMLLACPHPDSVGTWDCVRKACVASIPIYVVNYQKTHGLLREVES